MAACWSVQCKAPEHKSVDTDIVDEIYELCLEEASKVSDVQAADADN